MHSDVHGTSIEIYWSPINVVLSPCCPLLLPVTVATVEAVEVVTAVVEPGVVESVLSAEQTIV